MMLHRKNGLQWIDAPAAVFAKCVNAAPQTLSRSSQLRDFRRDYKVTLNKALSKSSLEQEKVMQRPIQLDHTIIIV